ncbi:DMT family transporter (plasmid) [Skermanella rosea]|uniref:DMT family transporter n=1 Tax=Skermanella rosea TaxID=1817965 RepID=UPI0019339C83|nr:DMT family transporter [Skermanella rosea]UEM07449.1 DMT family transporter [Skermanella rosea]
MGLHAAAPAAGTVPGAQGTVAKVALILAIGLFWGGNWPAVKTVLFELPPITLRAIGFSTGALALLAWARARGLPLKVPAAEIPWLAATGLLNILAFNLCTAFAQLMMPTSRAAIIAFTMPVWAALLAIPLLGERPGGRQVVGLALGLGGLLVLLGPEALRGGAGDLAGPFLVVTAAVSWALGTVLMKRRGSWRSHVAVVTGWQYALSALPVIVLAAVLESAPGPASWHLPTWLALGYHLVFSICIAQILWFVIVKRLTVAQSTIATLVIPVVGVAGSILVLGDPLTARVLIALALVVSAVACVMVRRRRSD